MFLLSKINGDIDIIDKKLMDDELTSREQFSSHNKVNDEIIEGCQQYGVIPMRDTQDLNPATPSKEL